MMHFLIVNVNLMLPPLLMACTQALLIHQSPGKERTYCVAQGNLLNIPQHPGWEGSLGENGCMYMYD